MLAWKFLDLAQIICEFDLTKVKVFNCGFAVRSYHHPARDGDVCQGAIGAAMTPHTTPENAEAAATSCTSREPFGHSRLAGAPVHAPERRERRAVRALTEDQLRLRLQQSPLLGSLSAPEQDRLLASAILRVCPARSYILREGEHPPNLYLLLDGLVHLCTTFGTSPVTVVTLSPGSCFGASALLRGEPMLTSAQTLRPSLLAEFPAETFLGLVSAMDPLAQGLLQDFAISYRNALRELKSMHLPNKQERLVSWLLTMHREVQPANEIELPFTKVQLAARLGMQPATLSRMFARLAHYGVEVRGRFLRVRDIEALRRYGAREGTADLPVP